MSSTSQSQPGAQWPVNGPSIEELQRGYIQNLERKQKQCGYQKKYMDKKKTELTELQRTISELQDQNQKLMSYYQLFELLKLQNPQLADQLIGQLRLQNDLKRATGPQITLPSHIGTPGPLGSQYSTIMSPSWPMVSLIKKE